MGFPGVTAHFSGSNIMTQILTCRFQHLRVIKKQSQAQVTLVTQVSTALTCYMIMVYTQSCDFTTNITAILTLVAFSFILFQCYSVVTHQLIVFCDTSQFRLIPKIVFSSGLFVFLRVCFAPFSSMLQLTFTSTSKPITPETSTSFSTKAPPFETKSLKGCSTACALPFECSISKSTCHSWSLA